MAEEDRLNIEWRHLLLEQGTLAEHSGGESGHGQVADGSSLATTEKVITQTMTRKAATKAPAKDKARRKHPHSTRGAFVPWFSSSASRLRG